MDHTHPIRERLIAQAEQAKRIMAEGTYHIAGQTVDLTRAFAASRAGTRLIRPDDWNALIETALGCCTLADPAPLSVTVETTMHALQRLAKAGHADLAALNFASARRPGGGWDTGAVAQEETIARASGLVATLAEAPGYFTANRQCEHLFYTEHAIWSPQVPCFTDDEGALLPEPYCAGIITMPAPNIGAMMHLNEADCRALPGVWQRRVRCVLALAIANDVRHLVLGAWGCGVFGNDPLLVARSFHGVLTGHEPWRHAFESVTFAIYDKSRHLSCLSAFQSTFTATTEATP